MSAERNGNDGISVQASLPLTSTSNVTGVFSENEMSLLKMVIEDSSTCTNSEEGGPSVSENVDSKLSLNSFSNLQEKNQGMQIVLSSNDNNVEFNGLANGLVIQDGVLNSEETEARIVYLNPDGTLVFDPAVLTSLQSTTEHSSCMIEPTARYVLSTTLQGNVVFSSGEVQAGGLSLGPHSQLTFNSGDLNENGSRFCHLGDYSQQTLTMVIEGTSSLEPEYILVEPNAFVDNNTLSSDDDKNIQGNYGMQSTYLDLSSGINCRLPLNSALHQKPKNELASFSMPMQPLSIQCSPPDTQLSLDDNSSLKTDGILELDFSGLSGLSRQDDLCPEPNLLSEKQKAELRHLEREHLEHHLKLSKKKMRYCKHSRFETEQKPDNQDTPFQNDEEIEALEKMGINDETPIFSSITAKINAAILNLVPGCHQFLLQQAQVRTEEANNITFLSDSDCTFNGSLKTLLKLHNELKRIIKARQRTFLEIVPESCENSREEKGISCELLRPYVSARGRQPKCSLKASQLGFVATLDNYLGTDGHCSSSDFRKHDNRGKQQIQSNKRKRGRPKKCIQDSIRENNLVDIEDSTKAESDVIMDAAEIDGKTESIYKDEAKEQHQVEVKPEHHDNNTDPVQARLLEEQIKYKKAIEARKVDLTVYCGSQKSSSDENVELTHGNFQVEPEVAQENPRLRENCNLLVKRRGRPCKKYDSSLQREKVLPRNPLTESAATKQQRSYEEHLAFKFFCSQCSFKTKRQSHYLSHLKCHKDGMERKHSCSHCNFVSISLPMLKRHMLKHKQDLFRCDICRVYTTDDKKLLQRHIKLKHSSNQLSEEKLSCHLCSFTCSHPRDLAHHQAGHERLSQTSSKELHPCPNCEKSFRRRMHFQRHLRDVHGPEVRPHLCDTCGKAFKRTDALQQHKQVHVSRTARFLPFKCPTCGKGFRSQAHLKEHSSMHSSERPYLCQYCGAAFKTQPVQRKHILTLHLQPKTYSCSVCSRQFNTKCALHKHENLHKTESEPAAAATTILFLKDHTAGDKQQDSLAEKSSTLTGMDSGHLEAASSISAEEQVSRCLVQEIIESGGTIIEAPLEQQGQGLEPTFIQNNQEGTLYYFTGELPTM